MAEKAEKDLEKALDESLEALAKSAKEPEEAKGEEKEPEEQKGEKKPPFIKDEKKDEDEAEGKDKKEPEDAKGDEKKEDEDESEKSMREGRKAQTVEKLSKSEAVANAVEVSKFLREFIKSMGDEMGALTHEVKMLRKENSEFKVALSKSQAAQADLVKSMSAEVATIAKGPLPRKGVVAGEVKTLEKGFRNNEGAEKEGVESLSKSQIADKLANLEIEHKVPMGTTSRFEATGELHKSLQSLVLEK